MVDTQMSISEVLRDVQHATEGERASLGDVLHAFGDRAYGPFIFIIGLIVLSPIGFIPGAAIISGAVLLLIAGQMALRSGPPWMPERVEKLSVTSGRAREAIDKVSPPLKWIEAVLRPRIERLSGATARRIAAACVCLLALLMIPLAIIPWGVVPPALAVSLFGLGLMTRDGLVMGIAFAAATAAIAASIYFLM